MKESQKVPSTHELPSWEELDEQIITFEPPTLIRRIVIGAVFGLILFIGLVALVAGNANGQTSREVLFDVTPEYVTDEYIITPAQAAFYDSQVPLMKRYLARSECNLYHWGDTNPEYHGTRQGNPTLLEMESTDAAAEVILGIERAGTFGWRGVNHHGFNSLQVVMLPRAGENSKTVTVEAVCFSSPREGNYDEVMSRLSALEIDVTQLQADVLELQSQMSWMIEEVRELKKAPVIPPPPPPTTAKTTVLTGGLVGGFLTGDVSIPREVSEPTTPGCGFGCSPAETGDSDLEGSGHMLAATLGIAYQDPSGFTVGAAAGPAWAFVDTDEGPFTRFGGYGGLTLGYKSQSGFGVGLTGGLYVTDTGVTPVVGATAVKSLKTF